MITDLIELETTVQVVDGATVALSDATGLAAGDRIIIESTHGYGEAGLDGVFEIANTPAQGTFYYTDAPIGKSFIGTVQSINGNAITLDRTVPTAAVGKTAYRDNYAAVKYAIENHLTWPGGKSFAVSMHPAPIRAYLTDAQATIDFNNCEIFAPRGCQALVLSIYRTGGGGVSNKVYRNLTLRGNARTSGYGLCAEVGKFIQGSATPYAFGVSGAGGPGGNIASNLRVENFTFIDNWSAFATSLVRDVVVKDCVARFTDHLKHYIQWEFEASSSSSVRFENCQVDTNFARPGFEAFKATDVAFVGCGGRNTVFSCNTSHGVLFSQLSVVWDQENPDPSFSPYNPILTINRTIADQDGQQYAGGDVKVRGLSVEYQKIPYPADSQIFNTVIVNKGDANTATGADIRGVSIKVPRRDLRVPNEGYLVRSDDAPSVAAEFTGDQLDGLPAYVKENVPSFADQVSTPMPTVNFTKSGNTTYKVYVGDTLNSEHPREQDAAAAAINLALAGQLNVTYKRELVVSVEVAE